MYEPSILITNLFNININIKLEIFIFSLVLNIDENSILKLKHETLFRKAYATTSCDVVAICMEMAQCPLRGFLPD